MVNLISHLLQWLIAGNSRVHLYTVTQGSRLLPSDSYTFLERLCSQSVDGEKAQKMRGMRVFNASPISNAYHIL